MKKKASGAEKEVFWVAVLFVALAGYYLWSFKGVFPGVMSDETRLQKINELIAQQELRTPITSSTTAQERLDKLRELQKKYE